MARFVAMSALAVGALGLRYADDDDISVVKVDLNDGWTLTNLNGSVVVPQNTTEVPGENQCVWCAAAWAGVVWQTVCGTI
jgi:hypothetical protein